MKRLTASPLLACFIAGDFFKGVSDSLIKAPEGQSAELFDLLRNERLSILAEFDQNLVPWMDTGQLPRGSLKGARTSGFGIPNLDGVGLRTHAEHFPNMTIGACCTSAPDLPSRNGEIKKYCYPDEQFVFPHAEPPLQMTVNNTI